MTRIKRGSLKNPYSPTVYGIGFIGEGEFKCGERGNESREYRLWTSMLKRCYSKDYQSQAKSYSGVTVDKEWFNLQNFSRDIRELVGYEQWLTSSDYELDKDELCEELNIEPKVYSKSTCQFISKVKNTRIANTGRVYKGKDYIGTDSEGITYEFNNITNFAKEHNLQNSAITMCVNGYRKHHKGWTFRLK